MKKTTPITRDLLIKNGFVPQKRKNPSDESSLKELLFYEKGEIAVTQDVTGWSVCQNNMNLTPVSGVIFTMEELLDGMRNLELALDRKRY